MATECRSLMERISARAGWGGRPVVEPQRKKLLPTEQIRDVMSPELEGADSPLLPLCSQKLHLSDSDTESTSKHYHSKQERCVKFGLKEPDPSSKLWNVNFTALQETPRSAVVISDSSDEDFENFLTKLKTPKPVSKTASNKQNDSLKDFIIHSDEDDEFASVFSQNKKGSKSKNRTKNDDDDFVIKSTWHDRHKGKRNMKINNDHKPRPETTCTKEILGKNNKENSQELSSDTYFRKKENGERQAEQKTKFCTPGSSDEEFESLMERIKNRIKSQTPCSTANKNSPSKTALPEPPKAPCLDLTNRKEKGSWRKPKSQSGVPLSPHIPSDQILKGAHDITEKPRSESVKLPCKVPDCFLHDLSYPNSVYVKNFKQKKVELTSRLYSHYNRTIFDQKLPDNMEIIWNKKMRKTAGYCVTGQKKAPEVQRYARIELSEKVCDSADRLRDTLIHEICHAATWLINGVRDGHGQFWRFYAKKATIIHPELPMVTRCHTYEINYKYTYECSRCRNTIGRHSKSLDTEKFVCALCKGKLVLLSSTGKDGSSSSTQLTPFAKFVKENYGSAKREMTGMSHAEVMRKLGADFSSKAKI